MLTVAFLDTDVSGTLLWSDNHRVKKSDDIGPRKKCSKHTCDGLYGQGIIKLMKILANVKKKIQAAAELYQAHIQLSYRAFISKCILKYKSGEYLKSVSSYFSMFFYYNR